ncbi:aldo/keto reductase [Candidatus Sumerlaeota bacterium]|nr:aldo/keto reductase [Candidatus Sumerlaeales bacterium]NLD61565.1 aldo/keto reductase [Candidatus Sumerlaeota bacterium]
MKTRNLGTTGMMVSEIGFGALEIGRDWAQDVNTNFAHLTQKEATTLLNKVLDNGINFIDTAPAYWFSEEYIGKALKTRRDEFYLATKVGEYCDKNGSVFDYSYSATLKFIDSSLQKLQTDHIDLIQIHSASKQVLEDGDVMRAMFAAKQAGKVLHIGMTGGVEECCLAIRLGGYETIQVPFNMLTPQALKVLFSLAKDHQVGVIIMRSLAGGKLTRKYEALKDEAVKAQIAKLDNLATEAADVKSLAHLAIAFVMNQEAVSTAIIGTRNAKTLEENIELSKCPVSQETLDKAMAIINQSPLL